jgi:hypothetical protein
MKVRFRGNSIRLRLTAPEAAMAGSGQPVSEVCSISPIDQLAFRLEGWHLEVYQVSLEGQIIIVRAPIEALRRWSADNSEGIYGLQENGYPEGFSIAIEKDYTCLSDRTGNDEQDQFPHPETGKRAC